MTEILPLIMRFDSLPSTNLEAARRAAKGAAEGLCIVSGEQTAGRGRLDRQWVSPKGAGLYFSIIFRPRLEQTSWPLLTLMAAVAVHDVLLDSCGLRTDIKWPNDVLADDRKLCGILAETVETSHGRAVVVGIGINLTNNAFPPELDKVATSVESASGHAPELEDILQALTRFLSSYYYMLQCSNGPEKMVSAWADRSSYAKGKHIRVTNGEEIVEGISRGLEPDGALRIETVTGAVKIVRAGDVSSLRAVGS